MDCRLSIRNPQPQPESETSGAPTGVQAPDVSDLSTEFVGLGQEDGKTSGPGDEPQYVPSSSGPTTHMDSNEKTVTLSVNLSGTQTHNARALISSGLAMHMVENGETAITNIQATDVALGLRRLPAGFYSRVHHSGLEWRTESRRSLTSDDVVEWCDRIPIPSDLTAIVHLGVYASFEFEPMLGAGEQLRELTATVEQLLDRSAKSIPFALSPKDGDILSSCSSILVTVEQGKSDNSDSSSPRVLRPYRCTTESQWELEDATNQGHVALSCYQRRGGEQLDLERSIEQFEMALTICPPSHPCRAAAQSNLAMAKFIHSQVEDKDAPLDVPISLYRDALASRPVGHVDRPRTLVQLAMVHFTRFDKRRDEIELAHAETLLHEAVELASAESYDKRVAIFLLRLLAGYRMVSVQSGSESSMGRNPVSRLTDEDLGALSIQLLHSFERSGDLANLQQAITVLEELLGSTLTRDGRYRARLMNLGVALSYRYSVLGELGDLEDAILRFREAVELTPPGHPDKPARLSNLGNILLTRFDCLGELRDLEAAISVLRDAVKLTPDGHPDKPARLNNLGNSFVARFERLGEVHDLEDAISMLSDAVELTPHDHPDKPACLGSLGNFYFSRFERLGELRDLEDAILRQRNAVELTPDGHPDKHRHFNNLGNAFIARFERLGELHDLEDAILMLKSAVDLTPDDYPDKPGCLSNLGNSFRTRFERLGELRDLEDAISTLRGVVELVHHGHPSKPSYLGSLGTSLLTRFERLGELHDLEGAISAFRGAVELTPHDHPDKFARLSNLGNSFTTRFERLGDLGDLEDAISRQRDAVKLIPHGHPDEPRHLNNLATSLFTRFEHLGELHDLEDVISTLRNVVELTPHDHPDWPRRLNNLGTSCFARFERLGELGDLEDAILRQRDAVELTPHDNLEKPRHLNNLGTSFKARFERLGELRDLEDAISRQRDAVELTPQDHPSKAGRLNNLGNAFVTRFEHLRELGDLEDAISTLRDAVELTPDGHPNKPRYLDNLGNTFVTRFDHFGDPRDLEQAISQYSQAACFSAGPIRFRFRAAQHWISHARRTSHSSLFHAYSVAIDLLPQLAWIGLSLKHRYSELMQGADVVRDAAAMALNLGLEETAVEWLEQGRSIVWGELFQLRSSYEELESVHPNHARELRQLSTALEYASATREKFSSVPEGAEHRATEPLEQEATRHRTLAIQRDKLLQEIRKLAGFERFLLHKQFSQLRAAAHSGPVVILNAAENRCDALIVRADIDHATHVSLPNFTLKRCIGLQNTLKNLLGTRVIRGDERKGQAATRPGINWGSVLSVLWKDVVKPVLGALELSTFGDLSRIFWCPTGPFAFLPIHAAGLYDTESSETGNKVTDFVVSSYVPTLSVLTLSHKYDGATDLRLLIVGQPPSDGQFPLPGVEIELNHIRTAIQNTPSAHATLLESSMGTVEEVLGLMKDANWVHFACHGVQDAENPTDSGLCLADQRRLRVSDIIALSRPRGGLAFLSACQTATGHKELSDEAIHIAAGMLFAGYGSVIGTMWSISDRLAPQVARDVYEQLFQNGTRPDYRDAARALHHAIERIRGDANTSFGWIPFIHVGL